MMSAYWRSPYREATNSFKTPNHSTLKFEQSLYLSRAKSSIETSRQLDWFDVTPRSQQGRNCNHPNFQRSNTNIKSILKTPRRDGFLRHGKDPDTDTSEESAYAATENGKKDTKKRVTFGFNNSNDIENGSDDSRSAGHLNKRKCPQQTLKRISHSKLIEESALKKLNRLIGTPVKDTHTPLPSVTGKGLSPRHTQDSQNKTVCSHSEDLRCIKCIRKDTEEADNDTFSGNSDPHNKLLKVNDSARIENAQVPNDKNKENVQEQCGSNALTVVRNSGEIPNRESKSRTKRIGFVNNHWPLNKGELNPSHSRVGNSASNNAKKYFRLLPGRYPFTAGAIQIKKLSVQSKQNEREVEVNNATTEETNIFELNKDSGHSVQKAISDNNLERTNRKASSGVNSRRPFDSVTRVPTVMPSSLLEADSARFDNANSEDGDGKACNDNQDTKKDKRSHILDWLNDVHQKQNFKPPGIPHPQQTSESKQNS